VYKRVADDTSERAVATLAGVRHHLRPLAVLALAGMLLLAACGSSSKAENPAGTNPPDTSGPTTHVAKAASNEPSVSAKMICDPEVKEDLTSLLGVAPIAPVAPTWKDHVYSCTYKYKGGQLTLAVKELVDQQSTDEYYASLATDLGKTQNINGLGQGAFTTKDNSAVVRKDYKVLLVDISGLPKQFGNPPDSRDNIALNVAATIMGCWTGA
jgi:hypothetical protein